MKISKSFFLVAIFCSAPVRADLLDEDDANKAPATPAPMPAETPAGTSKPAPAKPTKPGKKPSLEDDMKDEAPAKPQAPAPTAGNAVLAPKSGGKGPKKANDAKEPVHFQSEGFRALKDKSKAELVSNVIVTQGSMRLEADHAQIFYDEVTKDVKRVVADGNVKIFKIDEDSGEKIKALGNQVVFDNKARTVVLEGNARLWRGTDLVRGKKITYEMDTGWIRADRVVGEVHPGQKSGSAPAEEPKEDVKEDAKP